MAKTASKSNGDTAPALVGEVHHFRDRSYLTVTVPFVEIRDYLDVSAYDHETDGGFQRQEVKAHVGKLTAAVKNQDYSPTAWTISLTPWHTQNLTRHGAKTTIPLSRSHPLPLLDGNHRRLSFEALLSDPSEDFKAIAADLPVTLIVYLDSDPRVRLQDFLRLQAGLAVSRNLKTAMGLAGGILDDPLARTAFDLAKLLQDDAKSHLYGAIAFEDSRAGAVSISSLLGRDGVSLYAAAKLAPEAPADWIAEVYTAVYGHIWEEGEYREAAKGSPNARPSLLQPTRVLAPAGQGGSVFGSMLFNWVVNCLIFRLMAENHTEPTTADLEAVHAAVRAVFDRKRGATTSIQDRRLLAREFAQRYFEDWPQADARDGVPLALAMAFGSSIGVSRPKGRPKAEKAPTDPDQPKGKKRGRPSKAELQRRESAKRLEGQQTKSPA